MLFNRKSAIFLLYSWRRKCLQTTRRVWRYQRG